MTGRRKWRLFGPLAGLLVGGFSLSTSVSGAAPTAEGFAAVATAQGGRFTFSVPGFAVVEDVIDGGGPVAQAAVDAGGAVGFASLPYPGESAIAFPGLFNAVTGQPFPGTYPFHVAASHPTQPEAELSDPSGAYRLRATAAEGSAGGMAQLAGAAGSGAQSGSGGSSALASVGRNGAAVIATAETRNEALQLGGGALRIASVRSRSSTTYHPDQEKPATETDLVVEGGSAGGYSFGFGRNGFVVANQAVPVPAREGLAKLNSALAPVGLSLRLVGGQATPAGASADALEITLAGQAPIPGMPPGIIRLRLGGATSSISVGQGLGLGDIGPGLGGDGTPPAAEPSPGPVPGIAAPGSIGPGDALARPMAEPDGGDSPDGPVAAGGAAGGADGATAVDGSGSAPAAASGPAADQPGEAAAVQPGGSLAAGVPIVQPRRLRADGFLYGALLAASIALLVVAAAWRGKGVVAR